jgi:hypothetical protein
MAEQQKGDAGESQVQGAMDDANEKGYFGEETDPTPNEAYTATGQDQPTPETDDEAREAAQQRSAELSAEQQQPQQTAPQRPQE